MTDTICSTPGGHRYNANGRCEWCDAERFADWGWNGDMCAVWGKAIIIGERKDKEAIARLYAVAPDILEALKNAVLQIEYLHEKFSPTGSGEAILTRSRAIIAKATLNT